MGDSIYTILVVAWVVYGIYSAVKKNKAKANAAVAPPPSQSKPTAIESIFESLFQDKSSAAPVASRPYAADDFEEEDFEEDFDPESVESYQDQEEVHEYEEADYLDTVPEANVESKIDTYSGTDNIVSSFIQEEERDEIQKTAIDNNDEGGNTNSFEFDLRQAVIAQAVLERPYE